MSCISPLVAVKRRSLLEKGKYDIKIFSKNRVDEALDLSKKFGDRLLYLPCGKCEACKMDYRKDWAVRCEMESLGYRDNCFITLTLDKEHWKLKPVKEDLQRFIADLRDHFNIKCRYFACGELGSESYRSHYHLILFGWKPDDLKFYGLSKSGQDMFTSKFLEKVWKKGKVWVNDFDIKNASYVAGYVNKDKNQCFLMFSTRPGLGYKYMDSNFKKLFKDGYYQGKNGQIFSLPRYFEKVCDKKGYLNVHIKLDQAEKIEDITKGQKFNKGIFQDMELFKQNGQVMKDKLKKMKRSL